MIYVCPQALNKTESTHVKHTYLIFIASVGVPLTFVFTRSYPRAVPILSLIKLFSFKLRTQLRVTKAGLKKTGHFPQSKDGGRGEVSLSSPGRPRLARRRPSALLSPPSPAAPLCVRTAQSDRHSRLLLLNLPPLRSAVPGTAQSDRHTYTAACCFSISRRSALCGTAHMSNWIGISYFSYFTLRTKRKKTGEANDFNLRFVAGRLMT